MHDEEHPTEEMEHQIEEMVNDKNYSKKEET